MRILKVHNFYQQPGGEDTVYAAETAALRRYGHDVRQYEAHNDRIREMSRLAVAASTLWSREGRRGVAAAVADFRPHVVHFHNTFPLVSPAAYYACRAAGVPVAQSLHNPRLACPAATFYRDGRACKTCLGRAFAWPGVRYACYRGSRAETAAVASMVAFHRVIGTWSRAVDAYFVSAAFYRDVFRDAGLPEDRLVLMPHFVDPDPGERTGAGDYVLFVGRLKPEKGVRTLLRAFEDLDGVPLRIRGDGDLEAEVRRFAASGPPGRVEMIGRLDRPALSDLVKGARVLVWPSEGFYETFGFVAVEAFACGVPVIASRIGVMKDIVEHGRTGLLFEPGNPRDLRDAVRWAFQHPEETAAMGRRARLEYENRYTLEHGYRTLVETYERLVARRPPT